MILSGQLQRFITVGLGALVSRAEILFAINWALPAPRHAT